jgi:lipopolysaccharide biosynthesis glycosyltransferase
MQDETKAIVFIADNEYSDYARLAIKDAWEYSSGTCPIYLVHDERLSESNKQRLIDLANKYNADVRLVLVPHDYFFYKNTPMKYHITDIAYAKLLLGELLPKTVKYAYYVDIDVMFMEDLSGFLAIEPTAPYCAVDHNEPLEYRRLFNTVGRYMNAGVFVANLDKWRNADVASNAKEILIDRAQDLIYADQDLMMFVFGDDWEELPIEYNFMLNGRINKYVKNLYPLDWDKREVSPVIVHYLGPSKPWGFSDDKHTHRMWQDRFSRL